jgi:site-specific recombinase XerD
MRGFGEHLAGSGYWLQNPLRWIQGPKVDPRARVPRRIGREDLKRLWDQAAGTGNAFQRHLWLALLACLYGTGIRRGELERLDLACWNREEGLLRIDGRKTGQERLQPVSESIWRCIEAYLPHRQNVLEREGRLQERALFVSRRGHRMSGERIGISAHRLARKAGIPLITLHQFRHSCASDLLEDGVGLAEVQQVLGHRSISSTVRYLSVADPMRREAISKHPVNAMLQGGQDAH